MSIVPGIMVYFVNFRMTLFEPLSVAHGFLKPGSQMCSQLVPLASFQTFRRSLRSAFFHELLKGNSSLLSASELRQLLRFASL